VKTVLLVTVPPLAGAVIGFVTNVIAIRMLFRPLREVRVFGIRLPFTPGILPRQRRKLAENIGAMVERELVTPEIVRQWLRQPAVRENVRASVARFTATVLDAPLRDMFKTENNTTELSACIRSVVLAFARSPAFEQIAAACLAPAIDQLDVSLFDLLQKRGENGDEALEASVGCFIEKEMRHHAELIGERIQDEAENRYADAAGAFIRLLRRDDVHRQLETQGRIFLAGAVLKLNVFQRLFISAAQYDRTLHERMPEIIDGLIEQTSGLLADETVRRRLLALLGNSLSRLLAGEQSPVSRVMAGLVIAQGKKPLREIFSALGVSSVYEALQHLLALAGHGDTFFTAVHYSLIEQYGDSTLGSLLALDDARKKNIDCLLASQLLHLADTHIENALASVNVKALVSERINSLEMIRVERIVLDVVANQLKWIDVFGAILGFTIGLFQSICSWLFR
jgi:uncharacterized membrane protein YheB (UPF0754 family)